MSWGDGSKRLHSRDLRSTGQAREDHGLMAYGNTENIALGSPNVAAWSLGGSTPTVPARQFFNQFNIKDYFFHDMGGEQPLATRVAPASDWESFQSMEVQEPPQRGASHAQAAEPLPAPSDMIYCPIWLLSMASVFLLTSALSDAYHLPWTGGALDPKIDRLERVQSMMFTLAVSYIIYQAGSIQKRMASGNHPYIIPTLFVAALVYTMALHFAGWHSVLNGEGLFNSLTGALAITLAVLLVLYHLALFPRPFFAVYISTTAVLAGGLYFASSYVGATYSFVPRFWFFAALGACYCRVDTRLSGLTQAVLCGLVAQELGFYGVLPLWEAAKHAGGGHP